MGRIALIALTSAAMLPQPEHAQTRLPPIVRDAIQENIKLCEGGKFAMEPGFISRSDVNGDGIKDFILDYSKFACADGSHINCGGAGCLTQVFVSADGDYVKVLDENVRALRFARVHGRPAMRLELHGSACGRVGAEPCGLTLFWNGSKFSPAN
jgi:hypothetical protein